MRQYLKRHWKSCLVICLLLFGGCAWGALEYTHKPRFCLSCHVMEPYYTAWETSSHNMVGCVDCHYPPGLRYEFEGKLDAINQVVAYWTGTYDTKFYAEIEDISCMRSGCHDSRLLEGPLTYKRGIKFDHAGHYGEAMRGIRLRCTSCHSQIVQGNHMAVTDFTCFLCHFRGRVTDSLLQSQEFCLNCHDYPRGQISASGIAYNHLEYVQRGVLCQRCHLDVVRGNGEVEDRACLQCHSDPEQLSHFGNVEAVHLNHVTKHKVECFNCHANITHAVPTEQQPLEVSCATCHASTHVGPQQLYAGTGGRGVEDQPSPMYLAEVDCIGCHLDQDSYSADYLLKGSTMKPTVEGCVDCHGELGRGIFELWTETLTFELETTSAAIGEVRRRIDRRSPSEVTYEAVQLLEDAEFNLSFVRYGRGVHNFNYALALLERARADADAAVNALE